AFATTVPGGARGLEREGPRVARGAPRRFRIRREGLHAQGPGRATSGVQARFEGAGRPEGLRPSLPSTKALLHRACHHLDGDVVEPSVRDDDVRVPLRGLDEAEVHRADGAEVLFDDAVEIAAAFLDVPRD